MAGVWGRSRGIFQRGAGTRVFPKVGQERGHFPARGRSRGVFMDQRRSRVHAGAPSWFALGRPYLLFQPVKHTNIV